MHKLIVKIPVHPRGNAIRKYEIHINRCETRTHNQMSMHCLFDLFVLLIVLQIFFLFVCYTSFIYLTNFPIVRVPTYTIEKINILENTWRG